jgi:hypothetical protein
MTVTQCPMTEWPASDIKETQMYCSGISLQRLKNFPPITPSTKRAPRTYKWVFSGHLLSLYLSICLSVCLSLCLPVCLSVYLSTALVGLGRFFSLLIYTQSVGLLTREISPSQDRYLHIEQHKQRINAHSL